MEEVRVLTILSGLEADETGADEQGGEGNDLSGVTGLSM